MPAPDLFVTTFSVTTSMSVLSGNFLPPRCQKKVEQQLERTKLTDLCLTSRDLYEHRRHYFKRIVHGSIDKHVKFKASKLAFCLQNSLNVPLYNVWWRN